MLRRAAFPALPYLALLACGESDPAVRDAEPVLAVAEPLVTIGRQLEGPPGEIFTEIVDGRITPDGRHVVLLDASPPYVRVFDREGTLIDALAPEGDGPTEARDPHSVAVTDSSFALAEIGRISITSLEGDRLATFRELSFIPQSIARGCAGDWIVYGPGRDADSIRWLHALSAAEDSTTARTIFADENPGLPTIVRRFRPVVARDGRVLVYHDAPDTPRILEFDCPDYELVRDNPAESGTRAESEVRSGDGGAAIRTSVDVPALSSVVIVRGEPLIVRSRWKNGRWQELVDVEDTVVREGPAAYRILDVEADLALLAVSDPMPHTVVVDVDAVLKLAPLAGDGDTDEEAP